ncbi:MAG: glycogen/starch synthase [Duncaniella sp.]|nr:glycogen/starch synthase [Duncaniella sp.]
MENNKVLYISQEISPYLPETPMSVLGRDVSQGILGKGFEVRTFMPKYGCINERRNQLHEVIRLSGMNLAIDDTDHPLIIKVATLQPSRMQVYFIDNDDYFQPLPDKGLEIDLTPDDNDERIMFFVHGVIETVKKLRWQPAVIHVSGWVSSLAPLYLRKKYQDDPIFADSKIVYALHREKFDGTLDPRFVEKLKMAGFPDEAIATIGTTPADWLALNRLAIDHSDAIIEATADIPAELIEYAEASGKPFIRYNGEENRPEEYSAFYRSLLGEEE